MASYFYPGHQHGHQHNAHALPQAHHNHTSRRRAPRPSAGQNAHRQFRGSKNVKDPNVEASNITAFRARFEAGRSFDLEDDEMFCPNLLTFDERQSIHSSSDRSSISSESPESSPLQQQIHPHQQPTPAISLSSAAASAYIPPPTFMSTHNELKIHQPSAVRTRNAIPIVNPHTGMRVASPPASVSPGNMQQTTAAPQW